jgi:DNA-binding ferritin-like protein
MKHDMKEYENMPVEDHMGHCIVDMLFYVSQLHLAHWLTLKNHHHVVVGELYEELEEELDELAEQFIGACLPRKKPEEALMLDKVVRNPNFYKVIKSEKDILSIVDEITEYANKALQSVEKEPKFAFMRDSLMDIIAVCHSTKYKITQE